MYEKKSFNEKTIKKEEIFSVLSEMKEHIDSVENILQQFGTLVKDSKLDSWYASYIWLLQTKHYSFWIEWSDNRFEIKIRKGKQSAEEFIMKYESNFILTKFTDFIRIDDLESKLESFINLTN